MKALTLRLTTLCLLFGSTAHLKGELPADAAALVKEYATRRNEGLQRVETDALLKLFEIKSNVMAKGDLKAANAIEVQIQRLQAQLATARGDANGAATSATSSTKVTVTVYYEEDFKGKAIQIGVPFEMKGPKDRDALGCANDGIRSLKVPPGVTISLYDNDNFTGDQLTFAKDAATLGFMKGRTSSLRTDFAK